ncbi:hypothetical protein FOZ62_030379, partial [Perkinsus olseni]
MCSPRNDTQHPPPPPDRLRMRSSSDVSSLTQLLRGVPVGVIASKWSLFRGPEAHRDTYELSKPVGTLDAFISHSWTGSPLWKQISLLTALYLREGYIAMLAVLIPLSIGVYILPAYQELASVVVELIGAVAICFGVIYGYRLAKKKSRKMVFLDKCCIPQDDPAAKERGICSISVFLRHSDKLVIFWTADYFSRLWCVFEVASFLRTHSPDAIVLVSTLQSRFCISVTGCEIAVLVTVILTDLVFEKHPLAFYGPLIVLIVLEVIVTLVICLEVMSGFVPAKAKLNRQVESFRVEEAQCTLPEDTRVLRQTIARWYGSEEQFEDSLKTNWPRLGATQIPEWALSRRSLGIVMFPYFIIWAPRIACLISSPTMAPRDNWWLYVRDVLIACVMLACRTPLFAFVACKLTTSAGRHGVPNWVVVIVVLCFGLLYDTTEIVGGGVALFDSSLATQFDLPEPYGWIFVVPACACILAIWWTYRGHALRLRGLRSGPQKM